MWGLAGGGISHYVASLEKLNSYSEMKLSHVVIRMPQWPTHEGLWQLLSPIEITIQSRFDLRWVSQLRRVILDLKPDLLALHGFNGFIVSGISQLVGIHMPILATYHGAYFPTSTFRRLLAPAVNAYTFQFMKRRADNIVVVSENEREFLLNQGIPANKISIIYNGISEKPPHAPHHVDILREASLPKNAIVLGATSSFQPIKGIEYLLDAMAEVVQKAPNAHLLLFGKGPSEPALRRQVALLDIASNVHFMGFRSDVQRWLPLFDIFVIPSLYEAHSIGLLEAMRAQCTIMCTDIGGSRESIRSGVDGMTVPIKDSKAIAKALISLIENPSQRRAMGESAQNRFLENFTESEMLEKTLAAIRLTLNGHEPGEKS